MVSIFIKHLIDTWTPIYNNAVFRLSIVQCTGNYRLLLPVLVCVKSLACLSYLMFSTYVINCEAVAVGLDAGFDHFIRPS